MTGVHLRRTVFCLAILAATGIPFSFVSRATADEIDCLRCHDDLTVKKSKHAAMDMGCPTCHTAVDAADVPHKMKNKINNGLSSEQPELCYGCHDKTAFTTKTVHAAVGMGCTGCHDPHSSDSPKLLASAVPDICWNCHDKTEFSRKNVHAPVAAGKCLACHNPHSSDSAALLKKEPFTTCIECHAAVEKKPHAIRGFSNAGHPLGTKEKKDPKRPERRFYCGSCHNPHSSDSIKLFRYPAQSTSGLCRNCHTY